jgi:hypothetical protein
VPHGGRLNAIPVISASGFRWQISPYATAFSAGRPSWPQTVCTTGFRVYEYRIARYFFVCVGLLSCVKGNSGLARWRMGL